MGNLFSIPTYLLLKELRAAAQSNGDEISLALNVLTIAIVSNSLSNINLVQQQSNYGIFG